MRATIYALTLPDPDGGEEDLTLTGTVLEARAMAKAAATHGRTAEVSRVEISGPPRDVILHVLDHQLAASDTVAVDWVHMETWEPTAAMSLPGIPDVWAFKVVKTEGAP